VLFLLGLPALGFVLVGLFELLNALFGRFPLVNCWLRWGLSARNAMVEAVAYLLIASGCVGANIGGLLLCAAWDIGLLPGLMTYAAALLVLTVGVGISAVVPRATLGLTVERKEDGLIHVRGVHPDYLARLPEYPSPL
jgi:hypothetical protein